MKDSKAIETYLDYHQNYSKPNTIRTYESIFARFGLIFGVKAGEMVGVRLRPHDLRRHAARYESRFGVPIEVVSKIILRHANLIMHNSLYDTGLL